MKLSFVIPTLNEENHIRDCINSIKLQDPNAEIIIADGKSKDNTIKVARSLGAKVVVEEPTGAGSARNAGARIATGDVLCFIDADTLLKKNWVGRVNNIFSDERVVAASGPIFPRDGGVIDRILYGMAMRILPLTTLPFNFYQFQGPNMAFRKSAFDSMNGFKEKLQALEDNEIGNRAREYGKVVWDDKLRVAADTRRFKRNGYVGMGLVYLRAYWRIYVTKQSETVYSDRGG